MATTDQQGDDTARTFGYAEALQLFYSGEIEGEAFLSAMIGKETDPETTCKLANLLQLETETKAMLRPPMVAAGISIAAPFDLLEENYRRASSAVIPWKTFVQSIHDLVADRFLPLYRQYEVAARERGSDEEIGVCRHLVDHEIGLLEFARRELNEEPLDRVLEPLRSRLRWPV